MFFYSVILSEAKNPSHASATSGSERNFRPRSRYFFLGMRTVRLATVRQHFRINEKVDIAQREHDCCRDSRLGCPSLSLP
jgi:hypothetical protein